ncbi:MAG: hypothetical protein AAF415_02100 [Pseudomonadota bacterium]
MEPTKQDAGRGGEARRETGDLGDTLATARRLFAALSKKLEFEIDQLQSEMVMDEARDRIVTDLIRRTQKALQTVLDIEVKLAGKPGPDAPEAPPVDLDQARAEIERRLARLAA